jgi:hypothetical protein
VTRAGAIAVAAFERQKDDRADIACVNDAEGLLLVIVLLPYYLAPDHRESAPRKAENGCGLRASSVTAVLIFNLKPEVKS